MRFGDCVVDLDRMEIELAGAPRAVQPQVFEVLRYLLEHRDRVISRDELLDSVWGDRFVGAATVKSRIKSVRQAVGDDGTAQRVIKTIHARGYRFVAGVEVLAGAKVRVEAPGVAGGAPRADGVAAADMSAGAECPAADTLPNVAHDWPLVGRFEQIDELVARVADPSSASVLLSGPPGVGTSRLAIEVGRRCRAMGMPVAYVSGSPAHSAIPLAALTLVMPSHVLDVERIVDASIAEATVFRRAYDHIRSGAGDRRLVIVIDAVDELDRMSSAVLTRLIDDGIVFAIVAARTTSGEGPFAQLVGSRRMVRIDVSPLSETDIDVLLYRVLEGPIDLGSMAHLGEVCGGRPGVLSVLVAAALESGALAREEGVWRLVGPLRSPHAGVWPPDGMSTEAVRGAEILALVGEIDLEDAFGIIGDDAVDELERAGLLSIAGNPAEPTVALADPLLVESIGSSIGPVRARRLKSELLEGLLGSRRRPRDVAMAVQWAAELGEPYESDDILAVAQQALREGSDEAAEALAARVSTHDPTGRLPVTAIRAELCFRRAQFARAEALFAEVVDGDVDALTKAMAIRRLGTIRYHVRGDEEQALDWLAGHEALAEPAERAKIARQRAILLTRSGRADECLAVLDRISDDVGSLPLEAVLTSANALTIRGDLDRARTRAVTADGLLRDTGLATADARMPLEASFSIWMNLLNASGHIDAAVDMIDRSDIFGRRQVLTWMAFTAGDVLLEAGRPRAALELVVPNRELHRSQGLDNGRLITEALHARTLTALGGGSGRLLDDLAVELEGALGLNGWYLVEAMCVAAIRIDGGLHERAEMSSLAVARAAESRAWGAHLYEAKLLAAGAATDPTPATARRVAARIDDLAAQFGGRLWPIRAAHVRALAERQPLGEVRDAYLRLGYRDSADLVDAASRA